VRLESEAMQVSEQQPSIFQPQLSHCTKCSLQSALAQFIMCRLGVPQFLQTETTDGFIEFTGTETRLSKT
jgi:hypothetical protein